MLIFMITLHLHTPRAPACSQRREATFWKCTRIRNAHFQIIVRNTSYDMELYLSKYIPSLRGCNNIQKEHRVRSVRNIRDAPQMSIMYFRPTRHKAHKVRKSAIQKRKLFKAGYTSIQATTPPPMLCPAQPLYGSILVMVRA